MAFDLTSGDERERGSLAILFAVLAFFGIVYLILKLRQQEPDIFAPLGLANNPEPMFTTGGPNMPGSASLDAPVLGPGLTPPATNPGAVKNCGCGCGGGGTSPGATVMNAPKSPPLLTNAPVPPPSYVAIGDWCYLPPCH